MGDNDIPRVQAIQHFSEIGISLAQLDESQPGLAVDDAEHRPLVRVPEQGTDGDKHPVLPLPDHDIGDDPKAVSQP